MHVTTLVLTSERMATPPSRNAILGLYASMLRTSRSFSSYNFRHYFIQRTKDAFRAMQACFFFFFSHPFSQILLLV